MGSGLAPLKLGQATDSDRSGPGPGLGLARMDDWMLLLGFRSQATGFLETREDSARYSGNSNTAAMDGRADFLKKKLAYQCGTTRGVWHDIPRVLGTSL